MFHCINLSPKFADSSSLPICADLSKKPVQFIEPTKMSGVLNNASFACLNATNEVIFVHFLL